MKCLNTRYHANKYHLVFSLINMIFSYFPYVVNKWREGSANCRYDLYKVEKICVLILLCYDAARPSLKVDSKWTGTFVYK